MITIAAVAKNNVIGDKGDIPWSVKPDMSFFKRITTNNIVIMGRKTWDSIGKALPNRINVVITSDPRPFKDAITFDSFEKAHEWSKGFNLNTFAIGGRSIYEKSLPVSDVVLLTQIDMEFEGDTTFPDYRLDDPSEWEYTESDEFVSFLENTKPLTYRFTSYVKDPRNEMQWSKAWENSKLHKLCLIRKIIPLLIHS